MGSDFSELRKLAADLRKAGPRTGKLAQTVVKKTALDVEADARRLAPVDTGNLRGSIGHSDLRTIGTSGSLMVEIGPTANYGVYVEVGTSRAPAQPYMGPAMDRHAPAFEEAMGQIGIGALND
ncbi:hypothetical protein C6401_15210 [Arthrobacter woluwensis]|uniref:HK97-gp10 family putative phage morphogenesis protein n=1 Tax=Arthrobacter woluwensis TaxID=156980 RepID=UPI000D136C5D|nr:HK97-gp10 family putative phage morphogenesis protein [Arthrobacter woluwensis]PSS42906.1 hypothetical protein C6401_15210 [Arthrobacter woluwensis]